MVKNSQEIVQKRSGIFLKKEPRNGPKKLERSLKIAGKIDINWSGNRQYSHEMVQKSNRNSKMLQPKPLALLLFKFVKSELI